MALEWNMEIYNLSKTMLFLKNLKVAFKVARQLRQRAISNKQSIAEHAEFDRLVLELKIDLLVLYLLSTVIAFVAKQVEEPI